MEKKIIILIVALGIALLLAGAVFGSGLIIKTQNKDFRNDPVFYKALGDELLKRGEATKAIAAYEESLALEENLEVRSNLAVLYHGEGKYSEAINQLRALVESDATNPSYHYDLAVNLVDKFRNTDEKSLDDLYEALAEYGKAEQIEPGYSYASENIAVLKGILNIN